jgi:hypothetical protein
VVPVAAEIESINGTSGPPAGTMCEPEGGSPAGTITSLTTPCPSLAPFGERLDRERRDRELVGLRIKSAEHEAWQASVDQAARNAVAYRQNLTLMGELDKMINPPSPPPEPTVVVVEQDDGSADFGSRNFDVAKWSRKPRSWV